MCLLERVKCFTDVEHERIKLFAFPFPPSLTVTSNSNQFIVNAPIRTRQSPVWSHRRFVWHVLSSHHSSEYDKVKGDKTHLPLLCQSQPSRLFYSRKRVDRRPFFRTVLFSGLHGRTGFSILRKLQLSHVCASLRIVSAITLRNFINRFMLVATPGGNTCNSPAGNPRPEAGISLNLSLRLVFPAAGPHLRFAPLVCMQNKILNKGLIRRSLNYLIKEQCFRTLLTRISILLPHLLKG